LRFDDRLNTVLAQPAVNAHDRAVRWRQLVELLARASDLSSPLAQRALAEILVDAQDIDQNLRSAAARAVASPNLPLPLVILFAADSVAVAAPVLAAASLQPSQWKDVLTTASSDSTRFIRSLYPDLPAWAATAPPAPEPEYAVFEPVSEQEPPPAPAYAEPEREAAPQPEQAEAPPQPKPEPEPVVEAAPTAPTAPTPPQPAHAGPAAPIPSISEVLSRIEHLRQERQFARPQPELQTVAAPRSVTEGPSPLFRWECGPSGEIAWVEGVPRGPMIGRSLSNPGENNGVDPRIQRAFAVRAPFRDAVLTVSGEGPAAGEWKLSGVPAFEPSDGRFAGYRGVGIRTSDEAAEAVAPAEEEPLDEGSLRELIHELRTPLTAIIGFAEIIDGQYLGPADHSYRERAAEIVAQARLLLSAIEDLDIAAQLRSSAAAMDGSTDLNELILDLAAELKDRATFRGAKLDIVPSRSQAICSLERAVLERLMRRFCSALIDVATQRDRLVLAVDCDVGQCLVTLNLPQSLRGLSDAQLFGRDVAEPDVLASSFSLKLARGIAQTAGGDLRLTGDKLALVLPRRRT
jgi:hypothetical protein